MIERRGKTEGIDMGLRLRCDDDGCRRTYSPRDDAALSPGEVRLWAFERGWHWRGDKDFCPRHEPGE